jgi:N-acetylglucosaminyldiphosphoundecaprenol N-acetyl-beta-D-mannosaminyltransferase
MRWVRPAPATLRPADNSSIGCADRAVPPMRWRCRIVFAPHCGLSAALLPCHMKKDDVVEVLSGKVIAGHRGACHVALDNCSTASRTETSELRGPSKDQEWNSQDDLSRDVYSILGVPVDAIEFPEVLRRIMGAAAGTAPFLISTVNVNFLVTSQSDLQFERSLLMSELCVADGAPIVWLARLMGAPLKSRVAGSDIFKALKVANRSTRPLNVFFFGGADGVAARASISLNAQPCGLRCSGWVNPGFGSVEEISQNELINQINSSGADFLVAALGAKKGQHWLLRNHYRLRIPIRAHFGAALNFEAATIRRAPGILQKYGFEWLWRIVEEPHLWRRYWHDGCVLIRLMFTRILPIAIMAQRVRLSARCQDLAINETLDDDIVTLRLSGLATKQYVAKAASAFRAAVTGNKNLVIDLTEAQFIDCRFFGLLLMLRKQLEFSAGSLKFSGISPRLARLFRLNRIECL